MIGIILVFTSKKSHMMIKPNQNCSIKRYPTLPLVKTNVTHVIPKYFQASRLIPHSNNKSIFILIYRYLRVNHALCDRFLNMAPIMHFVSIKGFESHRTSRGTVNIHYPKKRLCDLWTAGGWYHSGISSPGDKGWSLSILWCPKAALIPCSQRMIKALSRQPGPAGIDL